MDESLIYAKTPRGVAEVGARSAQLSMVTRRVLIMMDGKRTVDDLAMFVRAGEIDAIVTQLETEGLAEKAGEVIAATAAPRAIGEPTRTGTPTAAPPVPDDRECAPITLEEAKRRAVRELNDAALALGTWQGIYLAEFDGPRRRRVLVQIFAAS